ncbi:MAG: LysR family transcriptional regulator [Pseudomonadota bacterium]
MDYWNEIHSAYWVARKGTVSGAAKELGVHRATVSRHIDVLEGSIKARLFIRHKRGYELTDAGREFLLTAEQSHGLLEDFLGRLRLQNSEIEGEITVATLVPLTDLIAPGVLAFRQKHPQTRVNVTTGNELSRLEYAEAHVAVRVGAKPEQDDYVVQPFSSLEFALFAHETYIADRGMPQHHDLKGHDIVGNADINSTAPFEVWLAQNTNPDQIVIRSTNPRVIEDALHRGQGVGFLPISLAGRLSGMVQVSPALPEWSVQSWIVTHLDVHWTEKVQSMLTCLKSIAPETSCLTQTQTISQR